MNKAEEELYYAFTDCDATNFSAMLFRLILKADLSNRAKLHMVYPDYVEAAKRYQNEAGYWENLCEEMRKKS